MLVMVLVKATEDSEKDAAPAAWTAGMMQAMGRFNDELRHAGVLVMAEGLKPTSRAKRVAFDGPERTVIDGPFAETRELVAGFWIWNVKDMDEAVAWVKRCPNPMPGPSEIEIRPFSRKAVFSRCAQMYNRTCMSVYSEVRHQASSRQTSATIGRTHDQHDLGI